jgi:DNA-binding transcriptional LysR family regulator
MQLNPRQIEAFRAVMLTGSMTVAAELLKITQPAVSRLVKDLEADLKLTLFRRQGNRLVPSHEATILFTEVDRFYVGMDRIAKIANDLRHAKAGTLRVASINALSLSCITQAISAFHSDRPAVNVTLESLNSRLILDFVAGRHFDLGFAQITGEFPGADLTRLPYVEAVCVVPAHYPIVEKEFLEPRDLQDLPYISLGRNSPLRLKIDQVFADAQVARHELLETSLAASAIALVASGLGVSIVDPFTATYLSPSSVVRRPFKPGIPFDVAIVRPTHYQHSRLCHDFIEIMVDLFKKEGRRHSSHSFQNS